MNLEIQAQFGEQCLGGKLMNFEMQAQFGEQCPGRETYES